MKEILHRFQLFRREAPVSGLYERQPRVGHFDMILFCDNRHVHPISPHHMKGHGTDRVNQPAWKVVVAAVGERSYDANDASDVVDPDRFIREDYQKPRPELRIVGNR